MFTIRFILAYKWQFAAAFVFLIAASAILSTRRPVEAATVSKRQTDSLNFVAARAQFNAVGDEFSRLNKISSGLADGMRDSVNACYRRADSLKTVFEASR